jgi:hypothetical protein
MHSSNLELNSGKLLAIFFSTFRFTLVAVFSRFGLLFLRFVIQPGPMPAVGAKMPRVLASLAPKSDRHVISPSHVSCKPQRLGRK